jgi:hypothetical protein
MDLVSCYAVQETEPGSVRSILVARSGRAEKAWKLDVLLSTNMKPIRNLWD